LFEFEVERLLAALKKNRHGERDRLLGLMIFRHGLRVSEAAGLRWDDIDFARREILVRRLKGSRNTTHFLDKGKLGDEFAELRRLRKTATGPYVFMTERGTPFTRAGIAKMIERAGEAAGLPFPVHVHMLRHATGHALANRGMDTRRLQHFLGHASITNTVRYTAMSPEPFKDLWR
jgi:type 1 fimbriae regulatory protein FimB/type 1 fimbriae regulatory protein FimE